MGGHLCSTLAHHRLTCLETPNNPFFYFHFHMEPKKVNIFFNRFIGNMLPYVFGFIIIFAAA